MKKHILLASLLSVGILSVTQSAQAFNPGHYPWGLKTGVKVEAKVTIYKDKDGKPAGFKLEALDPALAEAILENAFDFMDKDGAVYTAEEEKNDEGCGAADNPCKELPKDAKDTENDYWQGGEKEGGYVHWVNGKSVNGYTDDNAGGSGGNLEDDWKRGTK